MLLLVLVSFVRAQVGAVAFVVEDAEDLGRSAFGADRVRGHGREFG